MAEPDCHGSEQPPVNRPLGLCCRNQACFQGRFELSIDLASVHTPIWHLGTGLQCVNAFHIDIGFIACLESMSKSNT